MNKDIDKTIKEVIRKQSIILGPDIAILKAREVPELQVNDLGEVTSITGDPVIVLQKLVNVYVALSGMIVRKAMEPLLQKHLGDVKNSTASIVGDLAVQGKEEM